MAKKGQAVQLQLEVNNDDEWDKLMQKDGLIVIDVYSEWCGPCLGMQANLKKIKLELGGDTLILAMAKSDGIQALERFRNKSEPTWMFISKGKMVNLMFGADAPKLTRLISDELKKEQAQQAGQPTDRNPLEVTELAPEEKVRFEVLESKEKEIKDKEERKKAKEVLERRTKECENILTNLPNYGTVLIFPSARDKYSPILHDILDEAGLTIQQTEKVTFTEDLIKELCFFTEVSTEFTEDSLEELYNNESLMLLLLANAEIDNTDDAILKAVYGQMKKPPGSPDCVALKLVEEEKEDLAEEQEETAKEKKKTGLTGIWVPLTKEVRATALRMFFHKVSADYTIPEPPPEPEHYAIIFPLKKKDEVIPIIHQYQEEIMKHGIFKDEDGDEAKLVATSLKKYDKLSPNEKSEEDKLVLQVSEKKSECILALAQLSPAYMSANSTEGKSDCEKYFPDEYPISEDEEEVEEEEDENAENGEGEGDGQQEDEGGEELPEGEEEGGADQELATEGEDSHEVEGTEGEVKPPEDEAKVDTGEEQVKLSNDMLEELLFFCDLKEYPSKTIEDFGNNKLTLAILLKRTGDHLSGNIDDIVLQMVYGNSRKPPGDEKSPAFKLKKVWNESGKLLDWVDAVKNLSEDELRQLDDRVLIGIWTPSNSLGKAMVLKLLFPGLSAPYRLPHEDDVPLHVAVAFDAFKAREVFELSDKHPGKVISYGYFSSDRSGEAKLLGKTTDQYEARNETVTYEEKIIIQLAKDDPNCFMDFMDLGPSYISTDIEVGELDCRYFFPPGYNTPEAEIITYMKKKSKKKGKMGKFRINAEQIQDMDAQSNITGTEIDTSLMDVAEDGNDENSETEIMEDVVKPNEAVGNMDKATSPVVD